MTGQAGNIAPAVAEASVVPRRLVEFFEAEAEDCVARLSHVLDAVRSELEPDAADFLAAASALRGGATMVRLTELALLGASIERIGRALESGQIKWNPKLVEALAGSVNTVGDVLPRAGRWTANEDEKARAGASELAPFVPKPAPRKDRDLVLPIAALFHVDAGPHVLYVAVTPQTQFEQQLREIVRPTPGAGAPARDEKTPPSPRHTITDLASVFAPPPGGAVVPQPPRAPYAPQGGVPAAPAPRGSELHDLLQASVTRLTGDFQSFPDDEPPRTASADELVPIDALLYRGGPALARAKQLGDSVRAAITPATPEVMAELVDLIELARG